MVVGFARKFTGDEDKERKGEGVENVAHIYEPSKRAVVGIWGMIFGRFSMTRAFPRGCFPWSLAIPRR